MQDRHDLAVVLIAFNPVLHRLEQQAEGFGAAVS
jgi:hypothetical protein